MSKKEDNKEDNKNPFAQEIITDESVIDNNDTGSEENNNDNNTTNEQENSVDNSSKQNEEFENLKNQYIRLAADFDNYRKRQAQERENLLKYGAENTMKLLLPVLDTYERGKKACENIDDANKLRENCEVIFKQLLDALDKAGLKRIETKGKEFDPNLHEAVMQTQTNDVPDNSVVEEMQAGYMLADKVLRPAMVSVAVNE